MSLIHVARSGPALCSTCLDYSEKFLFTRMKCFADYTRAKILNWGFELRVEKKLLNF